jgi:hypothetical protein
MLVALLGADAPNPGEEGFQPLFDGRSLEGWQRFGGKGEAWRVEDGMIVSQGHGGGWLGTNRDYADFQLRLEFRLSPGSNSGVYLRAPADTSHISRTGMEIQVLDEEAPRHRNIQPWQRTGAIYHVAAPKPGHLKPTGEWNTLEVLADGPRVRIWLNGEEVVDDRLDSHPELEREHPGLKRTSGRIGLQSHNDRVEFRNLRIKERTRPRP